MTEVPHVAARPVPPTLPGSRAGAIASASGEGVPLPEHEFFVEEFRGITIVVALPLIDDATLGAAGRTVDAFRAGDTRFVFVVPADRVEVPPVDVHRQRNGSRAGSPEGGMRVGVAR